MSKQFKQPLIIKNVCYEVYKAMKQKLPPKFRIIFKPWKIMFTDKMNNFTTLPKIVKHK